MNVLVAGATGLVGRNLVELLEKDNTVEEIHVLSRRGWEGRHRKVRVHSADFSSTLNLQLKDLRPQVVFCCLGTTIKKAQSREAFRAVDYEAVLQLAKWAKEAGTQTFLVVSAIGANARSPFFYSRTKGEMEDALNALALPSTIVVRPSLLLGSRREPRPGEKFGEFVLGGLHPLLRGPFKKYRAIQARDVAAALMVLAQESPPGFHVIESERLQEIALS